MPTSEAGSGLNAPSRLTTVRDLLAVTGLRLRLRSGEEEALDRPVRWVHSTELPDPGRYLRGGELVCTVGVSLSDEQRCRDYVRAVSAAGGAAICFGVGDVHAEVPQALLDSCADLGIPLLELPAGAPFLALSEHLADRWVWAETAVAERGEELLTRLLDSLAKGCPAEQLVAITATATNGQLHVRDGPPTSLRWTGQGTPPTAAVRTQVGLLIDVARRQDAAVEMQRRRHAGYLLQLVGGA